MHVVLFDIDGTLVNSGGAGKAALEAALAEEFGLTLQHRVAYSGRTDRAIARDLLTLHGVDLTTDSWRRLLGGYLRRLPAALVRHPGIVLPGIAPLLERLSSRADIVLGLLTGNVREGARLKLGHFGLFHHFAFGGFGDDHFERDDVACEALAAARAHLDDPLHPERIWVVGDTPLDVRCARAIGAKVAAVATGWHPVEELEASRPDLLLTDLSDASPLLDRLGP
jgi:phosphoglycolate phosphatase-like HAD superfamily hydrolase